jgi:hypothetical protein
MTTDPQSAFTDKPPIIEIDGEKTQLKPLSELMQASILASVKRFPEADQNQLFLGSYIAAASMPGMNAAMVLCSADLPVTCMAYALELSEEDSQSVIDYLTRVLDRRTASVVEVAESPGKPGS